MATTLELLVWVLPIVVAAFFIDNVLVWRFHPDLNGEMASQGEQNVLTSRIRDRQSESITLLGIILAIAAFVIGDNGEGLELIPFLLTGLLLIFVSLVGSMFYPRRRIASHTQITGNRYALAVLMAGLLSTFVAAMAVSTLGMEVKMASYLLSGAILVLVLYMAVSEFLRRYNSDLPAYFRSLEISSPGKQEALAKQYRNELVKYYGKKLREARLRRIREEEASLESDSGTPEREKLNQVQEILVPSEYELVETLLDGNMPSREIRKQVTAVPRPPADRTWRERLAWRCYIRHAIDTDLAKLVRMLGNQKQNPVAEDEPEDSADEDAAPSSEDESEPPLA